MKRNKLIYFVAFLSLISCKKDITAFFNHASIETRVEESLSFPGLLSGEVSIDTTDFKFAVFSDIHTTEESIHTLDQLGQDVVEYDIDFLIVAGDLTENGLELEYSRSRKNLWELAIPYYVTIGNHDLYQKDGWSTWMKYYGPSTYSIRVSNYIQFIFIDSASGSIGKTQMQWLEGELKDCLPNTIVVSHYPIYNGISPSIWRLSSSEERYRMTSLLRDYNVMAYISGHYHSFEHYDLSGIEHFIVGSMYPESLDSGTRGYLLCSFKNGQFDWQKIEVE